MSKMAIYPGSFDPITNGHIDLIRRGKGIFSTLIVAVADNPQKVSLFSLAERLAMVKEAVADMANVEVASFSTLLTIYAQERQAQVILRGVRAFSDFDYEFQMALMNRRLSPKLETVFIIPDERYSYVSSRVIKEIARLGGPIDGLVPDFVKNKLLVKLGESKK